MVTRSFVIVLCSLALLVGAIGSGIALAPFARAAAVDEPSKKTLRDQVERLQQERRHDEARALAEKALKAAEQARPPDLADTLWWLATLGGILQDQGYYGQADVYLQRALAMSVKLYGPDSATTAACLNNLASNEKALGRFADAETHLQQVIAIQERGPTQAGLPESLNNLAELYVTLGRFGEAELLYKRALSIAERAPGADERRVGRIIGNLGHLYWSQGRFAEAETFYRRAILILERTLGSDHPSTALAIGNLAVNYQSQGRFEEAEPLLLRTLDVFEKRLGPNHPLVAGCLSTIGDLMQLTARQTRAEQFYRRAIGVYDTILGPDSASSARVLTNLGQLLIDMDRIGEAEPMLRRAVAIQQKAVGPEHPDTLRAVNAFATVEIVQGKLADAEAHLRRVVAAARKVLPSKHPDLEQLLLNLSIVLLQQNKAEEAFLAAKESAEIGTVLQTMSSESELRGSSRSLQKHDGAFFQEVRAAFALARTQTSRLQIFRDESFRAAQFAAFDETGRAVGQMAARFAAQNDPLGRLLQEQHGLMRQLRAVSQLLADAIGSSEPAMRARAADFRRQADEISARLQAIDTQLRRDSSAYGDLADPRPVGVAETQKLLGDDEAVVLIVSGVAETFLFAVSRTQTDWARASVSREDLERQVRALRNQIDPATRAVAGEPFDRAQAYRLYQELLRPLEGVIKGKAQLFVIPMGALTSLPFSVLVTQAPAGGANGDNDPTMLRQTEWLIKRHALATLPSVSSLRALRVYADKRTGSEAFAGFGDPVFDRASESERRVRGTARYFRGRDVNLQMLRTLPRLRASGEEIRAMAKTLSAPDSDVYLRERATEANLKTRNLSRKRTIVIATHGLIAGDFAYAEPGLALSPPATATDLDDGYLSASEAARLNLHADLIVLSACDTAAGEVPGANGLSGLARAFILAGSKSLLVSHWAVNDKAAMLLTTRTVAGIQKNPALGRAQALRQAMLSVMNDASNAEFAHPTAWAPFVLVGEPRVN